jgi:hypothetical protein
MSEPHSWNRRDFDVTPNGYFSILKPARWFARSPLAGGFRYVIGEPGKKAARSAAVPGQKAPDNASCQEPAIGLRLLEPSQNDRHLLRLGLIVLAAAAITLGMLWWISFRAPGL